MMLEHRSLPPVVHGIHVKACPDELERQKEELLTEVLECGDVHRATMAEVDGAEVICFFVESHKVCAIVAGLSAMGLLAESSDLSSAILMGRSCGTAYDRSLANRPGLVSSFRRQHLTIDLVLDKINVHGVVSLDEVDRAVLMSSPPPPTTS